jgi:putative transposase
MSYIGDKGISKRLRRLNNYRNFWIDDKIHKVSRYIVNICIENNIGNLVVGLNRGWKNGINLGKRINQKFVEIPFSKLIDKISYKCKLVGIILQVHEESYTSKVDHLAFEKLGKHDVYLGKRKKRGLFQSSIGKLINADINGAIGIGRKVFGDSYVGRIIDSGLAFNPVRVNIL